MILGDFKSTNLPDWYKEANAVHCEAHGHDYTAFHDAIRSCLKPGMRYKEFGTKQGVSAAAAMLCNPSSVEMVDIDITKFAPYTSIFQEYADQHDIKMKFYNMSSSSSSCKSEVDVLMIDSLHTPSHLRSELKVHGDTVKGHIILHDTWSAPELHKVLEEFVSSRPQWQIVEYYKSNVGYSMASKFL